MLKAGKKEDLTDDQGQQVDEAAYRKLIDEDRKKMLDFADYCQKSWPKERAGNVARQMRASTFIEQGRITEAVKELGDVTPDVPNYIGVQYQIADLLLKPDQTDGNAEANRQQALEVLREVPDLTGADPEINRLFILAKTRLGEELVRDKQFAEVETLIEPLLKKLTTLAVVEDPMKNPAAREYFRARLVGSLLRAKYFRADAAYQAAKFKEAADLLAPVIKDIQADQLRELANDKTLAPALLSLALRSNMQLGDLSRVKQVVEVYGKAIGEDPAAAKVPEVLRRLVPLIRVQVRDMKAKNDAAGLKRTVEAFTTILGDLAAKQKTPSLEFQMVLAQCFGSMDRSDKAMELLNKIKEPGKDAAAATQLYHDSRLVYLRMLRQEAANHPEKKKELLAKASDLLDEWMGTKEKPGWAVKRIDAHKELHVSLRGRGPLRGGLQQAQCWSRA